MEYSVILFDSTSHAIWASNLLKKSGQSPAMIPVPRHLSPDCGFCVRIPAVISADAERLMRESGIEFREIRRL